ncbi:FUSC family protein [Micromonospora sp. C32]|uniref:FUSC family protein n=1 Tax=Micromonospora sp. C32 TaxID=2824877 RepID=UPI001B391D98|nr:FUSC family protein [Micromonospora sp. C32]MBQ1057221.1 FUSC family protein [Micromonospora sp. C32]
MTATASRAAAALRQAAGRLRHGWRPVLQDTLAATVAWIIATRVAGHPLPFFAPAAALNVLAQARGRRIRRTAEVVIGVAVGVLVAELVVQALGPRTTGTVFAVLLLTVTLAVAFGASSVSTVQATLSALYLAVVSPPDETLVPVRFVDALIGGAVALVTSQVLSARRPLVPLAGQVRQTFAELAGVLDDTAEALRHGDQNGARAVLDRARHADAAVDRLRDATRAAGEGLRLTVRRRRGLGRLRWVEGSVRQVDLAVRDVRALVRAAVTLTRGDSPVPAELGDALHTLGQAVRAAGDALAVEVGVPLAMVTGQVRDTAIDLLRAVDAGDDDAIPDRVDAAAAGH